MHQEVLIPQLIEDDLRILLRPPDVAGRERRVLQIGAMEAGQLHPVAETDPVAGAQNDVVSDLEILCEDIEHARRHVRFHLQEGDGAVP